MADNIVSTISAPVIASSNINPWPAVDPDYILSELKNLKAEFCPNNKVFWKSYGKWISMSNDQRDKTLSFFNNLTPAIQLVVNIILELITLLIIQIFYRSIIKLWGLIIVFRLKPIQMRQ